MNIILVMRAVKKNLLRGSFIKKLTKSIAARSNLIKFDTVKLLALRNR